MGVAIWLGLGQWVESRSVVCSFKRRGTSFFVLYFSSWPGTWMWWVGLQQPSWIMRTRIIIGVVEQRTPESLSSWVLCGAALPSWTAIQYCLCEILGSLSLVDWGACCTQNSSQNTNFKNCCIKICSGFAWQEPDICFAKQVARPVYPLLCGEKTLVRGLLQRHLGASGSFWLLPSETVITAG